MNKKHYIVALGLALTLSTTGYAANPASKEYVDTQVTILLSQIANIPAGPQGPTGPQGPAGQGVPTGGTTGQVLAKIDNTNYNTQWVTQTSPQYTIGQNTEGGIVFFVYMDSSNVQHALIAAPADESVPAATYTWSDAVAQCANKNDGTYADWFLPNKAQISALFYNRYAISPTTSAAGSYNDPLNNGGFLYSGYWSSSEASGTNAWAQDFGPGNQGSTLANSTPRPVRCVRAV